MIESKYFTKLAKCMIATTFLLGTICMLSSCEVANNSKHTSFDNTHSMDVVILEGHAIKEYLTQSDTSHIISRLCASNDYVSVAAYVAAMSDYSHEIDSELSDYLSKESIPLRDRVAVAWALGSHQAASELKAILIFFNDNFSDLRWNDKYIVANAVLKKCQDTNGKNVLVSILTDSSYDDYAVRWMAWVYTGILTDNKEDAIRVMASTRLSSVFREEWFGVPPEERGVVKLSGENADRLYPSVVGVGGKNPRGYSYHYVLFSRYLANIYLNGYNNQYRGPLILGLESILATTGVDDDILSKGEQEIVADAVRAYVCELEKDSESITMYNYYFIINLYVRNKEYRNALYPIVSKFINELCHVSKINTILMNNSHNNALNIGWLYLAINALERGADDTYFLTDDKKWVSNIDMSAVYNANNTMLKWAESEINGRGNASLSGNDFVMYTLCLVIMLSQRDLEEWYDVHGDYYKYIESHLMSIKTSEYVFVSLLNKLLVEREYVNGNKKGAYELYDRFKRQVIENNLMMFCNIQNEEYYGRVEYISEKEIEMSDYANIYLLMTLENSLIKIAYGGNVIH